MSTGSDKPFLCSFQGCGQRFTNHDHLSTHQQKHEFSLKFKAGEALLIDQTPTPTRFLRNCEESGLFQELEEANPFEQDFAKSTTNDSEKSNTDDPQAEAASQGTEANKGSSTSVASETTAHTSSMSTTASIPVAPPPNLVNPDKPVPMASAPAHISTASALTKQKLLQNIQMKEQQKLLEQTIAQQLGHSPEILAQALKTIIPVSDAEHSPQVSVETATFATPTDMPGRRRRGRKPDDEDPEVKRQRFLERNRAAASRCRAKKKVWVDNLEKKAKETESLNTQLQQEVMMLRSEVQQLKSILIAHKDCPLIVHQTNREDGDGELRPGESNAGVTLLSQLANMPSMSPLITSPVPSVGSVVPNMSSVSNSVSPAAIIITTNGYTQQTPEVAKDVEIAAETEPQVTTE